ncbi:MAG: hypothetical protein HY814_06380, partial [Candidatus Riflebacteria bacterium]|nr:hypothetical protein [Candidatus Riflebacteria bacterium]
ATLRSPVGRVHQLDSLRGRETLAARAAAAPPEVKFYSCPMHLQLVRQKAGACPECQMNLEKMKRRVEAFVCPMHPEVASELPGTCPDCHMFLDAGKRTSKLLSCPMHPETVSDRPDKCSACGMKLEPAPASEPGGRFTVACSSHPDLEPGEGGFCGKCCPGGSPPASADGAARTTGVCCSLSPKGVWVDAGPCPVCRTRCRPVVIEKVLAVPDVAVIDTGTRKVVYLDLGGGVFDAVEVELGSHTGGYYPVQKGLQAGARVVTAGAFLVDAEARLSPAAGAAYFGAASGPKQPDAVAAPAQTGGDSVAESVGRTAGGAER